MFRPAPTPFCWQLGYFQLLRRELELPDDVELTETLLFFHQEHKTRLFR